MHPLEIPAEDADQIHHRIRPGDRTRNRFGLGEVSGDELRLAEPALRLQKEGLARIALRDSHARAPCEQGLRDIAAEKTPAANQRNQCVFHVVRLVNAV